MIGNTFRDKICIDLAITDAQLERLTSIAPHSYKIYSIPKKTGGVRVIAQPSRETKVIQHWLINNVFDELPVHKCATAYSKGASIKKNALVHCKNPYMSKFDFKKFFPSIKIEDVIKHLTKHLSNKYLNEKDISDIARLCCIQIKKDQELCLSIGAPTSPLISNSVMFDFDSVVENWCKDNNIFYTRYADDLTFSTKEKNISSSIEANLKRIVKSLDYPNLRFNNKKTVHLSKKFQRRITGIVIDNEGNLSIGREKKRLISSQIHKYKLKQLSNNEISFLQGQLGFAKDVDSKFIVAMNKKYGTNLISEIFSFRDESHNNYQI